MQLIQTTFPESTSFSFNTGTTVLIFNTMSMDSIGNSGVVRFVHSKVTTNSFKLTSVAYPRAPELSVHEMFPLSSVVILLHPSDVVYLVERSSASVDIAFNVGF
jgi:hypothetical protein